MLMMLTSLALAPPHVELIVSSTRFSLFVFVVVVVARLVWYGLSLCFCFYWLLYYL
jgi:hypothetical protein